MALGWVYCARQVAESKGVTLLSERERQAVLRVQAVLAEEVAGLEASEEGGSVSSALEVLREGLDELFGLHDQADRASQPRLL